MNVSKLSDKKLISLYKGLHNTIYVAECFGVNDIYLFELIEVELNNRGYNIKELSSVSITKGEIK